MQTGSSIVSGLSADHSAERAKRDLAQAEKAVHAARQQLEQAEARYAQVKEQFFEADLRRDCSWNKMYRELVEWKDAHDGDVLVLTTKNSPAEVKKLGKWVQNQRVHYKYFVNGDTKFIKAHRVEALNRIGFVWNVLEYAWDTNFQQLELYHAENGHFNVPRKHNVKLNSFVTNLRKAMRRKNEGLFQKELTEERIERLNAINFSWNLKHPARQRTAGENVQFDHLYDLLVDFKETYGHVQVSKMMPIWRNSDEKPAKPEYKRLPFFIASVRSEHELFAEGKPCALDEEKVRKLTELGIKWKKPAHEPRVAGGKRKRTVETEMEAKPRAYANDEEAASGEERGHGDAENDHVESATGATVEL